MRNHSTIRVGVLHSLSGTMAEDETPLSLVAQMAIDEINESGGVLGKQVEAVLRDGASDPAIFANQARELLAQEQVETIFGCWTSSSRKAVRPVVEENNSLLWYPVQYEGLEQSPNIIYTGSCLNQQIDPAVAWALSQGKRRCFLVGSDYVFPRTANSLIRALVSQGGGCVLDERYAPLGSSDFSGIVEAISANRPDIVFNTINGDGNHAFFREFQNVLADDMDCPVMSFSFSETGLHEIAQAAFGHYACWSYFQSVQTPENRDFLDKYKRRFGPSAVASDPIATAYTQVYLWKQIVEDVNSCHAQDVLSSVQGHSVVGPGGVMEIQANHHVMKHALIGQATAEGQFDVIWSSDHPIEPKPWLGVEDTELAARSLIIAALNQYPEVVNLNVELEDRVRERTDKLNRANEELRLTQYLVDHSEQAAFWIELEGRILYANNAACRSLDYSREELHNMSVADIDPDCPAERWVQRIAAIKQQDASSFESRLRRKDGTVFPVLVTVSYSEFEGQEYLSAFVTDVTERRKVEDDLRRSESRFKRLYDSNVIGVMFWNTAGDITDANDEFLRMVGYTKEEIISGKVRWKDMTPPEYVAGDEEALEELASTGITMNLEKEYFRKDGSRIPILLGAATLEGSEEEGICYVLDLTERKKTESQIHAYQERLRALASELTLSEERERRRIATELHDGAAQSLAFARMRLASACKAVAAAEAAKKLDDVSQILRESLQQIREVLLDLSSPSMNEIGLGVAISDWLAQQIGRRHGLRTSFADECGKVPLDDDVRAVLFRNTRELLANVVKHAGADSVSIRIDSTGDALRITIEDDGAGFDPDRKASTTEAGGFGLFSIREFMLDLGGSLEIVSAPGKGCQATLVMPLDSREERS